MLAGNRDRLILAGSVALATVVPMGFLWPVHRAVRESAAVTLTPVPPLVLRLTGAASTKPLFAADRQPHDVETQDSGASTPVPPAEPPRLVGLVVGRGRGVALIKLASGETVTVGPGEAAGDWHVDTVGRSEVTLSNAGRRLTIALDYQNKPSADAASGPPASAAPTKASDQENP